jgi:hypothetical protein
LPCKLEGFENLDNEKKNQIQVKCPQKAYLCTRICLFLYWHCCRFPFDNLKIKSDLIWRKRKKKLIKKVKIRKKHDKKLESEKKI